MPSKKPPKRRKAAAKPAPVAAPQIAPARPPATRTRFDGWQNVYTGVGTARDKAAQNEFVTRGYTFSYMELDALYHETDMIARICNIPAEDMTREWLEVLKDEDNKVKDDLTRLKARQNVTDALVWADLYGGSVIFIGADDGKTADQPLDLDNLNKIDWLQVLDRWDLEIDRVYDDPVNPKYNQPEMYRIASSSRAFVTVSGQIVRDLTGLRQIHESRLIRFDGPRTANRRVNDNNGWNDSIVERVYDVVMKNGAAFDGLSALLADYAQGVIKIKNLANMLASDSDDLILKRIQNMDIARSILQALLLDADNEDFQRVTTPTAGLAELLTMLCQRVSSATGIPMTKLMGISPGGLNATGEGDQINWHNEVSGRQETKAQHQVQRLIDLICAANKIKEPRAFKWNPLWTPSEKEIAETRSKNASTDQSYIAAGVLTPTEVRGRFEGDEYASEIQLNGAKATYDLTKVLVVVGQVAASTISKESGIAILTDLMGIDPGIASKIVTDPVTPPEPKIAPGK